jgi:hypothetical protein
LRLNRMSPPEHLPGAPPVRADCRCYRVRLRTCKQNHAYSVRITLVTRSSFARTRIIVPMALASLRDSPCWASPSQEHSNARSCDGHADLPNSNHTTCPAPRRHHQNKPRFEKSTPTSRGPPFLVGWQDSSEFDPRASGLRRFTAGRERAVCRELTAPRVRMR